MVLNLPQGSKLVTSADYFGEDFDTGEVFIVDKNNTILSGFSPAWAKDANGNPVPTHYKVKGNKLIQVVDFNENTVFPVVADPDLWAITKCAGALATFVGGNLFAASKIIKAKKYINELGGFRKSAELLLKASTWQERFEVGGDALVSLGALILGTSSVEKYCMQ